MSAPVVFAIVSWANRRRAVVLTGAVCLLLVSVLGIRRLSFDADILSLLPRNGRATPAFRDFLASFGSLDHLYVVFSAPEGRGIGEYRDQIDGWVEELRHAPEIATVDAGVADATRDFSWLASRQLLLLRGTGLDDALNRLTPEGLARAVSSSRALLAAPSPEVAALVRQDPAGLLTLLRPTVDGIGLGLSGGSLLDGYVSADGRTRLVLARPKRPPYDTDFSRALDRRLREVEALVGRRAAAERDEAEDDRPPLRVEFAGGHRVAVETEVLVRRESITNTVGSLAVILPLLFLLFRSGWLMIVGALPSTLALLMVLGARGFLGATLSAAGTGASAMLFGLGIDGVVLLYVAYLLPSPDDREGDTGARIAGPSASMLLGMWTTAATFYGLVFVDVPSLQQLGILIGNSMMVCGIATLLLVPALLPRRVPAAPHRALTMPRLAAWIPRHRRAILVSAAVLTLFLGASARRLRVDPSLDRLRSVTAAAQLEARIAAAFGLPDAVHVVLASGPDLEPLLQTNERLVERLAQSMPGLRVQPPTWLLPSAQAQARTAARIEQSGLTVTGVQEALAQAARSSGFRPQAFEPFTERLPQLLDPSQRLRAREYAEHGLGDLLARLVVEEQGQWKLATYVFPSTGEDVVQLQSVVDEVDATQILTGLPLVNAELSRAFTPEFLKGLGIGAVLVTVLVVGAFRSWRLSFCALLPTAIGLAWTAGALAIAGIELDLFAAFAVVTLLGIGVDYGVHLVHRYQDRGDAAAATAELAPVILVAATITIAGYGTLVSSAYPPLRSIGLVSVTSVIALTVASVLVLPALLMGIRNHDS